VIVWKVLNDDDVFVPFDDVKPNVDVEVVVGVVGSRMHVFDQVVNIYVVVDE
jgi:hypothetical protein